MNNNQVAYQEEQVVDVNGIRICYDSFGNSDDPPLLLIMGLGMQLIGWPEQFCRQLAAAGFWVIRFDNRDVGRSTQYNGQSPPSTMQYVGNIVLGRQLPTAYSLDDMAADASGLLTKLGVAAAHIIGVSMGGMIAQLVALNHPEQVLSLTSIMSTTGERDLPRPSMAIIRLLLTPPPTEYEAYLDNSVAVYDKLSGSRYPINPDRMRTVAEMVWQRGRNPAGSARQLAAVAAAPGRRARLRRVDTPALVIHGDEDPLVPYAAGVDTAEAIPNARLVTLHGLGHSLPENSWPELLDAIIPHMQQAVATVAAD